MFKMSRGFTVTELLVTIAIVSIIVALLLPAVQQARESARRTQCQSNLRQIGLALHGYHELHFGFPPGYAPTGVSADGRWFDWHSCYAWSVHLLPLLDQGALYQQLEIDVALEEGLRDPTVSDLVQTPLQVFRCPSDLAEQTLASAPIPTDAARLDRGPGGTDGFTDISGASSSYVGNCGYWPPYHPGSPVQGILLPTNQEHTGPNNGVLYTASHVSFGELTDGASQTLAIGERAWFQGSSTWVGTSNILGAWPGGAAACLGRVYWRINEIPDPPGRRLTPASNETIRRAWTSRSGFGSYHPNGAHFLFCDGSVRFLSESIDSRSTTTRNGVDVNESVPDAHLLGLFQLLGIRNDGRAASDF